MGDPVAIVLNTDPPSVLTELGTLGADGRPDRALIKWPLRGPGLIDLTTLAVVGDYAQDPRRVWQLRGDAAIQMELVLNECSYRHDRSMRFGHSSVAEARILLHSRGRCTGCRDDIDLVAEEARDVYIQPSTRRRAMRRSQSSEPKHTRAIATTRYPTAVGCRRFLPTGPACCAVGACRGCKRRGTPACWTFGSRGIRSAPVVERSGLRERCTGSWRIETSRRGLTHEVAAERATTGHARRAGSSGDAFSGPRDAEPTVLVRRHPGAARRPSLWCR